MYVSTYDDAEDAFEIMEMIGEKIEEDDKKNNGMDLSRFDFFPSESDCDFLEQNIDDKEYFAYLVFLLANGPTPESDRQKASLSYLW